ncbi:hypothetical protein VNI00_012203 [Paramarasmius palmivorus]|uniref:F-box domain-containing protein n=1 Tax=Paramarasmius palmivorus TaxID=297713 RepID=A0AAW0C632_9AGAR
MSQFERLPVEILTHIFQLAAWRPVTVSEDDERWTISRVCRSWRNIVLNTPGLWTEINVDLIDSDNLTDPIHAALILSTAFRASADSDMPLHLTLQNWPEMDIQALPLLNVLAEHIWGCSSLIIDTTKVFEHRVDGISVFSFLRVSSPPSQLRILTLMDNYRPEQFDYPDDSNVALTYSLIPHLNQLHSLKIRGLPAFCDGDSVPPFPWEQIRYLEVKEFTRNQITEILRRCSNLETLVIHEDSFVNPGVLDDALEPVRVNSLRRLCIPAFYGPYPSSRVHHLSALLHIPNLQSLEIPGLSLFSDTEFIVDLIERSQCNLTSVDIDVVYCTDVTVERLLRLAPHCTNLVLRGQLSSYLFDSIASRGLVPDLQYLSVRFPKDYGRAIGIYPLLQPILNAAKALQSLSTLYIDTYKEALDESEGLASEGTLRFALQINSTPFSEHARSSRWLFKELRPTRIQDLRDTLSHAFISAAREASSRSADILREVFDCLFAG